MGFLSGALRLLPLILSAVKAVERLKASAPGPEKKAAAIDLTGELLPVIEGAVGRDVFDDERVKKAAGDVIDAYVSVLNVVRDVQAERAAATTPGS